MLHKIWFRDLWIHVPLALVTARESASWKSVYARMSIRVFAPAIKYRSEAEKRIHTRACVWIRVYTRPIDLPTHFLDGYSTYTTRLSPSRLETSCVMHSKIHRRFLVHRYMKLLTFPHKQWDRSSYATVPLTLISNSNLDNSRIFY